MSNAHSKPTHDLSQDPDYNEIDIDQIELVWRMTWGFPAHVTAEPQVMFKMVYMAHIEKRPVPLGAFGEARWACEGFDDTIIKIDHAKSPYGFIFISARLNAKMNAEAAAAPAAMAA